MYVNEGEVCMWGWQLQWLDCTFDVGRKNCLQYWRECLQQVTVKTLEYGNETLFALIDQCCLQHSFHMRSHLSFCCCPQLLFDNLQQEPWKDGRNKGCKNTIFINLKLLFREEKLLYTIKKMKWDKTVIQIKTFAYCQWIQSIRKLSQ